MAENCTQLNNSLIFVQQQIENKNNCSECEKSFKSIYGLKRHVKLKHAKKQAPVNEKKYDFKCTECNRNFSHRSNLKYHMKNHGISLDNFEKKGNLKCVFCDFRALFKSNIIDHYKNVHDLTIESEILEFSTIDKFYTWKAILENQTKSKFIKERGSKNNASYYVCHRSGFFNSKSEGKRHLKTQGSNKINGFCPASLKVIYDVDDKLKIHHIKTHVGHQNELNKLFLTPSERRNIQTKIAANIPFDTILNDIRSSASSETELERMHLITKKDLYNIKASFNVLPIEQFVDIKKIEIIYEDSSVQKVSETQKEETKEKIFTSLNAVLRHIETEEELQIFEKLIEPIEATLAIIKANKNKH